MKGLKSSDFWFFRVVPAHGALPGRRKWDSLAKLPKSVRELRYNVLRCSSAMMSGQRMVIWLRLLGAC